MATGKRDDPFRGFNFRVEIDGITEAGFRECAGIDGTTDVVEYRDGKDKGNIARKLTGLNKHSNITLKWGITSDKKIWDWYKKTIDGKTERVNGSITLYDEANDKEAARWNFVNGWPTKLTGPSFNATSNDVAIETLDIAHEGLTQV
jgi:phage tail-like protein